MYKCRIYLLVYFLPTDIKSVKTWYWLLLFLLILWISSYCATRYTSNEPSSLLWIFLVRFSWLYRKASFFHTACSAGWATPLLSAIAEPLLCFLLSLSTLLYFIVFFYSLPCLHAPVLVYLLRNFVFKETLHSISSSQSHGVNKKSCRPVELEYFLQPFSFRSVCLPLCNFFFRPSTLSPM